MLDITLDQIKSATSIVYAEMQPTPQYCWPLLCENLGTEVWVKHENHSIIGSFKIRSSLNQIKNEYKLNSVFCCASNGNYGQGLAFACNSLNKRRRKFSK